MRKTPTVFQRNPDDMKHVLSEVNPVCQWVLDGEGTPTRKYDGTCVGYFLIVDGVVMAPSTPYPSDDLKWYARREVKPGKQSPDGFIPVELDINTGKTVGWEPMEHSSYTKIHAEAVENYVVNQEPAVGTYELCGPKVQGNPEGLQHNSLIPHDRAEVLLDVPRDYDGLREYLIAFDGEGIVWHHDDGRMAKLKRRDFE